MSQRLTSNHIAIAYNNRIRADLIKICEVFFSNTPIKHFSYCRLFYDGLSLLYLRTTKEITEFILDKNSSNAGDFHNAVRYTLSIQDELHHFLWPYHTSDFNLSMYASQNVCHGLSIYRKQKNYIECWSFATTHDHPYISNFYFDNLATLHKFITYFSECANSIIETGSQTAVSTMSKKLDMSPLPQSYQKPMLIGNNYGARNDAISVKGYIPTPREQECLTYLIQGKSAKQTAYLMNISSRSVESYLHNLKTKTGCHKGVELVSKFNQYTKL